MWWQMKFCCRLETGREKKKKMENTSAVYKGKRDLFLEILLVLKEGEFWNGNSSEKGTII